LRRTSFLAIAILAILVSGIVGVMLFRVAADEKPHSVLLKWNPPAKPAFAVAGYNVYRSPIDGRYQRIASGVPTPTFVDHDVIRGKTYYYFVRATDANGQESPNSNQVLAAIPER
jgi:fibronectin type 3 domain-containing protein